MESLSKIDFWLPIFAVSGTHLHEVAEWLVQHAGMHDRPSPAVESVLLKAFSDESDPFNGTGVFRQFLLGLGGAESTFEFQIWLHDFVTQQMPRWAWCSASTVTLLLQHADCNAIGAPQYVALACQHDASLRTSAELLNAVLNARHFHAINCFAEETVLAVVHAILDACNAG